MLALQIPRTFQLADHLRVIAHRSGRFNLFINGMCNHSGDFLIIEGELYHRMDLDYLVEAQARPVHGSRDVKVAIMDYLRGES